MAGQIDTYRNEIFNFLRTVTIKFEPFAYLMGKSYMDAHGIDDPHGEWNPYYIHLCGEYTSSELASKPMTVWTVEYEEATSVIFNKDLKKTNPKTAALYRIPNVEYTHLEEQYPDYRGLLRCMVYPVKDMKTALEAPNLSLLAYDDTLLELNERESIVKCLKDFLEMVRTRWWIPEFQYEDMYAVTFWAMLWQLLPIVLLKQRFLNIRTPYVHSFHVWEYLISNGIGDYRDVLTREQSLWLYRNLEYIKKNKGKHGNLQILAENLLEDACVSLLYKDMYQETTDFATNLYTKPNFLSFNFVTHKLEKTEQVDDLNPRLVLQGLEPMSTLEYQNELEVSLGTHNYNILPLKYLEFKKDPIDTSNESEMITFFTHTLLYRASLGKLSYRVKVTDPFNGTKLQLFVKDMIALWYYATLRGVGVTPTYVPTKAYVGEAYKVDKPTLKDIREYVYLDDKKYTVKSLVAVQECLDLLPWESCIYLSRDDFMTWLTEQWKVRRIFKRQKENSHKYMYHRAFESFHNDIKVKDTVDVELSEYSTYTDWIEYTSDTLRDTLRAYENGLTKDVQDRYATLALSVFDSLFDTADTNNGTNTVRKLNKIYTAIRNLFISLCSYNVTYLENDRDQFEYLHIEEPDFVWEHDVDIDYSDSVYPLIIEITDSLTAGFSLNWTEEIESALYKLYMYYWIVPFTDTELVEKRKLQIDANFKWTADIESKAPLFTDHIELKRRNIVIEQNFTLHTGLDNFSCRLHEE